MKQQIVIISSGQPSANPRLVKEAVALDLEGYKVTVIYVPISPWADDFDMLLFQKYPQIKFIQTGYHPQKHKLSYKWARLRRKNLSNLYFKIGDIFNIADFSTILFGQELLKEASKHKADLYIAHNLGALPAAVKAAIKYNAKLAFDAEDYHRGEFASQSKIQRLTQYLEEKYFPLLDYLSTASPLIEKAYLKSFPALKSVVINNCFPLKFLPALPKRKGDNTLKLWWFSQSIGKGRGLEDIIKAVCEDLKDESLDLTLYGNYTEATRTYFKSLTTDDIFERKIKFHDPISQEDLFKVARHYHIGLALEPGRDFNNDAALSNKIFTYLLAGNALILSDTSAQTLFFENNPLVGLLYKKRDNKDLSRILKLYIDDPGLLAIHQQNARNLAEIKLNWEIESRKLLAIVESALKP